MELSRSLATREGDTLKAGWSVSTEEPLVYVSRFRQWLKGDDVRVRTHGPKGKAELPFVCSGIEQGVRGAEADRRQVFSSGGNTMADHRLDKVRMSQEAQALSNPGWQLQPP